MALSDYLKQTQRLLNDTEQRTFNPGDLVFYINQARVWLAGDSQSIKFFGNYNLTTGFQGPYLFSAITLPGAVGVSGVLSIRQQFYLIGDGQLWFRGRSWPWFTQYFANFAAATKGPPKAWAQYAEGVNGTIFIGPVPDQAYTISADCICIPSNLGTDSDPEAIPAPWTIAVPYYAAYLALLSAPTPERRNDAVKMLQLYDQFMTGARRQVAPDIMPSNFSQQPNPVRTNQLGISEKVG
jgi:hypothetical protein